MDTWQETVTALSTAIYALFTGLLLLGVVVAYRQLRALRRNQQLELITSSIRETSSREMLDHIQNFIGWARPLGSAAPRAYCVAHQQRSADFLELHNHRRVLTHFIRGLAVPVKEGLLDLGQVTRLIGYAIEDWRFVLGVEFRLARQLANWDGRPFPDVLHRWTTMELYIDYWGLRSPETYGKFRVKTWWTPCAWLMGREERAFSKPELLPRYNSFLERLQSEPGQEPWATAALLGACEDLSPDETKPQEPGGIRAAGATTAGAMGDCGAPASLRGPQSG